MSEFGQSGYKFLGMTGNEELVYGLLHLLGYDDLTEKERLIMHARQDEILAAALRSMC